jgi:hypothetical protein
VKPEDAAQIEECNHERANQLLAAGFSLLGIYPKNGEVLRKTPGPGTGPSYIKHDIRYVIGRRVTEPAFPPAPPGYRFPPVSDAVSSSGKSTAAGEQAKAKAPTSA